MRVPDSWWVFALMVFAVASGQIGRLGRRMEQDLPVGRKQIMVELTMLPAFGALGGALAAEYDWPVYFILGAGIAAGWTGFGTFRLLVGAVRAALKQPDDKQG
ncbi:hypothetical protein [Sphingomonas prati]|uniref:Uncharacterized protein n=1 Tax=Sphingomonas prati TaxID=1843237 RepID=A0A7W9F297_9SPHN|nr:hypothetical protein [Sphingomonas prati]MBB5728255.1 hypothetical protein [Sphingomonas prati]GGE75222.1 hypothetical protein GCM10011404_04750 [Sphingomonas prati]